MASGLSWKILVNCLVYRSQGLLGFNNRSDVARNPDVSQDLLFWPTKGC